MPERNVFDASRAVNFPTEDLLLIPLTRGKFAVINAEDYPLVAAYKWAATPVRHGKWYATAMTRNSGKRNAPGQGRRVRHAMLMHRVITGARSSQKVDHWNNDGLDNRRANLRICTVSQNHANRHRHWSSAGYKGVVLAKGRYQSRCGHADAREYLGSFRTAEEAARAYDVAAKRLYGDFACLNFPDDDSVAPRTLQMDRAKAVYSDRGERWDTSESAAQSLGVQRGSIRNAIAHGRRCKGRRLSRTAFGGVEAGA